MKFFGNYFGNTNNGGGIPASSNGNYSPEILRASNTPMKKIEVKIEDGPITIESIETPIAPEPKIVEQEKSEPTDLGEQLNENEKIGETVLRGDELKKQRIAFLNAIENLTMAGVDEEEKNDIMREVKKVLKSLQKDKKLTVRSDAKKDAWAAMAEKISQEAALEEGSKALLDVLMNKILDDVELLNDISGSEVEAEEDFNISSESKIEVATDEEFQEVTIDLPSLENCKKLAINIFNIIRSEIERTQFENNLKDAPYYQEKFEEIKTEGMQEDQLKEFQEFVDGAKQQILNVLNEKKKEFIDVAEKQERGAKEKEQKEKGAQEEKLQKIKKRFEDAIGKIKNVSQADFDRDYAALKTKEFDGDYREIMREYLDKFLSHANDSHSDAEKKSWKEVNETVDGILNDKSNEEIIIVDGKKTCVVRRVIAAEKKEKKEIDFRQLAFRELYLQMFPIAEEFLGDKDADISEKMDMKADSFFKGLVDKVASDGGEGEEIFNKIMKTKQSDGKVMKKITLSEEEIAKLRSAMNKFLPDQGEEDDSEVEVVKKEETPGSESEQEREIAGIPEKAAAFFVQAAKKAYESCEVRLSGENGEKGYLDRYDDPEDKQQFLLLLVKPTMKTLIEEKLTGARALSDENKKELLTYILDSIKK